MIWAAVLLLLNAIGIAGFFATLAGRPLTGGPYELFVICLMCLGGGTLGVLKITSLIQVPSETGGPHLRTLGDRLRRSLVEAVAWFTVGTFYLMLGGLAGIRGAGVVAMAPGAAAQIWGAVTFFRQFRRYARWRSLRSRREA